MPKKGKKGGKKGGKKKSKSKSTDKPENRDPIVPEYVPPPPWPGEQLMKVLKTHEVDEKEVNGIKVSTRILEHLTPQEIRDLKIVFETFDYRGIGMIGPVEVRKAFKGLGFKLSKDQVRQMIFDGGSKANGLISLTDFLELIIDKQGSSKDIYDEILQGFKLFDFDQQGKISMDNLKLACETAGVRFTKQELQDMMEEADTNGDGCVDKDEFVKVMLQTNLF